jgi:hypothetical protein
MEVPERLGLPFFCPDRPWTHTPGYEYTWNIMRGWPKILETA